MYKNKLIILAFVFSFLLITEYALSDYNIIKFNTSGNVLFNVNRERDSRPYLMLIENNIISFIEREGSVEYIIRYNSMGNVEGVIELGLSALVMESNGRQMFCVAGYGRIYEGEWPGNNHNREMRVECYQSSGNIMWKDSYLGDSIDEYLIYEYSGGNIAFNSYDEIYIVGFRAHTNDNYETDTAKLIWKYNYKGKMQWVKEYYISGGTVGFVCDNNDHIIMLTDEYLIKMDENGEILWKNELDDNSNLPEKMVKDNNDNIYILNMPIWKSLGVYKINTEGEYLWSQEYMCEHGLSPIDIELSPDGGIVIVGNGGDRGMALVKYSSEGELVWNTELFNDDEYGDNYHIAHDMVVDKYGVTYLLAFYCTYDPGEGCREGYNVLMKFNSSGQLMWESRYEGDKKSSALNDNDEEAIYVAYGVGIALSSALQQEEEEDDNTPYPDGDDDDDDSGCGC